ncbi:hypothetical protein NCAS_0G02240 [Naumovozyma castellii]|uniref:C2 domain-containing protein n=1 Tax=Naumovozyma castellii TaxID=27288 RepID=G0VI76_NAUCA|nr:hypothetical protein NCAS_0G02240 [Naumovozyma castellii CBS 4309]CCC71111.1 hypothetical protein NCAS_0G02240 [Naumovozyma castellii CBS 4309]
MEMSEEVWSGSQGTLCVYVSKAKDLPNLIKLDKQNVMLRLRIAHMTRESDTLFRAGQNPVFNYLEKFDVTPDVKPIMNVEVYCDRKKKAPLPIGKCEIDLLNGIRADPKEGYCTWYELKRDRDEFAGMIFIELTFTPKLNQSYRERTDSGFERLDASIASRPIPPLPNEIPDLPPSPYQHSVNGSGGYMHASEMRQVTPSVRNSYNGEPLNELDYTPSRTLNGAANFTSSVDTNETTFSQATSDTVVTAESDTKFHFANLRKLKEKINIFKNPSNSVANESKESPVDIEALQKAIGVASLSEDDDSEDGRVHYNETTRSSSKVSSDVCTRASSRRDSNMSIQPPLPPLPEGNFQSGSRSPTSRRTSIPRMGVHNYSPTRLQSNSTSLSPQLPMLPTSPYSRRNSASPTRRRIPPNM